MPDPKTPARATLLSAWLDRIGPPLRAYFYSGWAFFIPYLVAYLLYAWLKWPANPSATVDGGLRSVVPSLLSVYWTLHGIHILLAATALASWWREQKNGSTVESTDAPIGEPTSVRCSSPAIFGLPFSVLWRLLPWCFLGLLFWIPGIYLEWPSDPWEHLRRINEWHAHDVVTAHSSWTKSSYFLPYSLTGHGTALTQLNWLHLYYVGVCLLLSWQYYRLARCNGLNQAACFAFVLVNAITFGNNIFSFYRYYGISSSIVAQIAAIALTRLSIEVAQGQQAMLRPAISGLLALVLIVANHIQGLAIAGIGVSAVLVWRLIEYRRAVILVLALAAAISSMAVVLWFPYHTALDAVYRPQGWLTAGYAFNLFSPSSPASERALHILGAFGWLNVGVGAWLIVRRNNVAGWLTVLPVLVLLLPCSTLPFAHVLARSDPAADIIVFHRVLFAVPMGLAFVAAGSVWASPPASHHPAHSAPVRNTARSDGLSRRNIATVLTCLLGAIVLSPAAPSFNRFWHSVHVAPADLMLRLQTLSLNPAESIIASDSTIAVATPLGFHVNEAFAPSSSWYRFRSLDPRLGTKRLESTLECLRLIEAAHWKEVTSNRVGSRIFAPADRPPHAAGIMEFTAPGFRWEQFDGTSITSFEDGSRLVLGNQPGAACHVFTSTVIPVNHAARYLITAMLRQEGSTSGINYLAVAWYDAEGRFLPSDSPGSSGADNPVGWANGKYSYFGRLGQAAPKEWTSYSIAFGVGESAAIPSNAAFIRIGALLNYTGTPNCSVQLTSVRIVQKPPYSHIVAQFLVPRSMWSASSLPAQLSRHWSPQIVHVEQRGLEELRVGLGLKSESQPR